MYNLELIIHLDNVDRYVILITTARLTWLILISSLEEGLPGGVLHAVRKDCYEGIDARISTDSNYWLDGASSEKGLPVKVHEYSRCRMIKYMAYQPQFNSGSFNIFTMFESHAPSRTISNEFRSQ